MGRNLSRIAAETETPVARLSPSIVKSKMKYFKVPENEAWRVPLLRELTDDNIAIPGFSSPELSFMKDYLCTS